MAGFGKTVLAAEAVRDATMLREVFPGTCIYIILVLTCMYISVTLINMVIQHIPCLCHTT